MCLSPRWGAHPRGGLGYQLVLLLGPELLLRCHVPAVPGANRDCVQVCVRRCACAGVRAQQEIPSHPRLSLQVDQSGLGLPSRDYYLNKTENEKVGVPLQRVAPAQTTSLHGSSPSVFPQCTHLCRSLKLEEHRGVPYLAVPGRGGVSFVPILE